MIAAGTFFVGGTVGLGIGLFLASRSWDRGYQVGARTVTVRAMRALEAQAAWFGLELARLAGKAHPLPPSDEVQAEQERRGA